MILQEFKKKRLLIHFSFYSYSFFYNNSVHAKSSGQFLCCPSVITAVPISGWAAKLSHWSLFSWEFNRICLKSGAVKLKIRSFWGGWVACLKHSFYFGKKLYKNNTPTLLHYDKHCAEMWCCVVAGECILEKFSSKLLYDFLLNSIENTVPTVVAQSAAVKLTSPLFF